MSLMSDQLRNTAEAVKKTGEVTQALNTLENKALSISNKADRLAVLLDPIMRKNAPMEDNPMDIKAVVCDLAAYIGTIELSLRSSEERLDSILQRIEL